MKTKITFKEVKEIEDLEKCFELRYKHFNVPKYRFFLNGNGNEIDLDYFDFYSRHWAIFNETNQIIGYARIIQKRRNAEIANHIQKIVKKRKLPNIENELFKFPIFTYQTDSTKSPIAKLIENNPEKEIYELSRFIINKGVSFRLSKFMINSGLGIYKYFYQSEIVLLACFESHKKFWKHYGFTKIKEDEIYFVGKLKAVNLYSELTDINKGIEDELKMYANQYELNKEISILL